MDSTPHPIREIVLELLRPGPAHNQLLSPLTHYVALCGAEGPFTVAMPFEHAQLLTRLERLRYEIEGREVATSQREAELRDLGLEIGKMFGAIPSFLTLLGAAAQQGSEFVNLRLSLSGSELGLIPFEAAIAPDGVAGSGKPLFLRAGKPITLTRELRRGEPLKLQWNRPPRILFVSACPAGFAAIPDVEHIGAFWRALEPWIGIGDDDARFAGIKKILTVLPGATLDMLRKACAETEFTHVHILAHGAPFQRAGDGRFGIALHAEGNAEVAHVVGGDELALAIMGRDSTGRSRQWPTVVSLATCDSGNQGSVLTRGGSIAQELHVAGIPWVFASQFPLWMRSSWIAAEVLYAGLLSGNDPRWVLHELRQRLRTDAPDTHDWASIVAYATIPADFNAQVAAFRTRQTKSKIEVRFDRLDRILAVLPHGTPTKKSGDAADGQLKKEAGLLCQQIRADLKAWRDDPSSATAKERAERLGMSASSEKRIANFYQSIGDEGSPQAYRQAVDFYRAALELEPTNHWVITQVLSLVAIPELAPDARSLKACATGYRSWWVASKQIAEWGMWASEGESRVWALGTLLELELLGSIYDGGRKSNAQASERICQWCREMLSLCKDRQAFPIQSTLRQFKRYVQLWDRPQWAHTAQTVVKILSDDATGSGAA